MHTLCLLGPNFCLCQSCDALRDLVPFAQFKKREKHPWRSVAFSKVPCYWGVFLLVKLQATACKWYQIAQRTIYSTGICGNDCIMLRVVRRCDENCRTHWFIMHFQMQKLRIREYLKNIAIDVLQRNGHELNNKSSIIFEAILGLHVYNP